MPLYVVATPIGNIEDLSPRALQTLKDSQLILAEDTRKIRDLVAVYGLANQIERKSQRCDSRAEQQLCKDPKFIEQLKSNIQIALVSDAGSPAISDPGASIVALAYREGVQVIPVPGPSAVTTALSISGFSDTQFIFAGYFPRTSNERCKIIQQYKTAKSSIVFYETAQRIDDSLKELCELWGAERQALLARELTKQYESLYRGTLPEIKQQLVEGVSECKGEMVLVLEGVKGAKGVKGVKEWGSESAIQSLGATLYPDANQEQLSEEDKFMLKLLLEHLPSKTGAAIAAKITSKKRKLFYEQAIKITQSKKES
ncbi:MAG: 16S rRNA (cytidine(1402)-2'-O)-methyltransferase [Candidatus Portiera sp.]|nr:16S rRNA (cytidine(1402)-2'-O)-methyltransferase [Portiera sp.]